MARHLFRILGFSPLVSPEDGTLGALPGARVNMPQTGDYVHVGLLPPDEAKALPTTAPSPLTATDSIS